LIPYPNRVNLKSLRRCGNAVIPRDFLAHISSNKSDFCAPRQKLNRDLPAACVFGLAAPQHERYRPTELSSIFISTMRPSSKG
jgi:hypothetical protein